MRIFGFLILIVSYLIFYNIYKTLNISKWVKKSRLRAVGAILLTFILFSIGINITDSFAILREYHDLFTGLFLGISAGIIPHVVAPFNRK